MSEQEKIEEDIKQNNYKLKRDYIERILESVDIPDNNNDPLTHGDKIHIALMLQQNLLLARLTDLLMIATGITNYTDEPPSSDILGRDGDIPASGSDKDDAIKEAMSKNVMCGSCGNGVMPDPMGYCPRCSNDLKIQVSQELLNKKQ